MNHEQFQELVNLYLDEGLNDDQSAPLFDHLMTCDQCRNLMRSSLRIRSFYQGKGPEEVPASLDRRVAERARTRPGTSPRQNPMPPFWTTRISVPLPVAASILFLILVGSLLFSPIIFQEQKLSGDERGEMISHIPPEIQQQLQLFR